MRKGRVRLENGDTIFVNSLYSRSISFLVHSSRTSAIISSVPCSVLLAFSYAYLFSMSVKSTVFFFREARSYAFQSISTTSLRITPFVLVRIVSLSPNLSTANRPMPFSPTCRLLKGGGEIILTLLLLVPTTIHLFLISLRDIPNPLSRIVILRSFECDVTL